MANADDQSMPQRRRGLIGLIRRLAGQPDRSEADAPPEGALELIEHAEAFQTLRVDDVMTPRVDVIAVDISTPFQDLVAQFIETEHSRLPVYRDTLDDPVGVVHIKDVFKLMADAARRPGASDPVLHKLRRDALYVPASMRAADLLLRMQTTRIHMALVIDEFGGTDGLVTLEDLIEAVVGDIADEHDEAEVSGVVQRPGNVFEVDARAPLEDLEEAMGEDLAPPDLDEEIDTVAGLVTALAGRVPQRGEVIAHPGGFDIEITDADPRRVKRVRVRPSAPPPPAA
jgi:CBS domain containing-hemolysin-like protein